MKVFCSGSCRLMTSMRDGYGKVEPIHSMFHNFVGKNFLGKLHNIKQHIQFIQWLNNEIEIPEHILCCFLTSYCRHGVVVRNGYMEPLEYNPIKKKTIQDAFKECEYYIFEICSLKIYERDGYQVQHELTDDYTCRIQTETELYNDLKILYDLLPKGKKILFQTHFRPNIIYNDPARAIENREIIYTVVNTFCNASEHAYLYDPSLLLRTNHSLFDGDSHFYHNGHHMCFQYLYEHFIQTQPAK